MSLHVVGTNPADLQEPIHILKSVPLCSLRVTVNVHRIAALRKDPPHFYWEMNPTVFSGLQAAMQSMITWEERPFSNSSENRSGLRI